MRELSLPSTATYLEIQKWGANLAELFSFSSWEKDRIGQYVLERYLDDREDLKGTVGSTYSPPIRLGVS
jgi:hypothetical protein